MASDPAVSQQTQRPRFIVDHNVGKLARALRLLGFDSLFFTGADDGDMVKIALAERRVILTRDTHVLERKEITRGMVKALLIEGDNVEDQIGQVYKSLDLSQYCAPFNLCLECSRPLESRTREEVERRVPPYVWQTQKRYVECPCCHRIYWQGTHWQAMQKKLEKLEANAGKS
jgi:uncharacterized protein with PIN domain